MGSLHPHAQAMMQGVTGETMCELGAKLGGKYKRHFESIGFRHVSIDLNGSGGALALDLTEPLAVVEIGGPFDVVTNFGTTEHVEQQEPCWRNVHNLLKVGGLLVSATPAPGHWAGHGRWYPSQAWYREYCELNGYDVESLGIEEAEPNRGLVCLKARKIEDRQFRMPTEPIYESAGGKVGMYQ